MIAQIPHKHSKSSEIRILIQIEYRCQQKTLKENSNIQKIEFQVTREPATTGTHLEIVVMDLHDITRREFRQFQTITSWWRNPGAQPKKNIHTRLISKQHSRKTVS